MTKNFKIFLFLLLILNNTIYSAKIFFDLGTVIINEYKPTLWSSIINSSNPIEAYFDYGYQIFKPFSDKVNYKNFLINSFGKTISDRAKILFYDLQVGLINNDQALEILTQKLKTTDLDREKKDYLQKTINNLSFAKSFKNLKLFKEVPSVMQLLNKQKHQFYVLSNWSNGFKDYFLNNFDDFFKFIPKENIIISAEIKAAKPYPNFYQKVIDRFGLSKEDLAQSWFIDDRPENIKAAQHVGLNGIVHENWPKTLIVLKQNKLI